MKKFIATILTFTLCASALCSCAKKEDSEGTKRTLRETSEVTTGETSGADLSDESAETTGETEGTVETTAPISYDYEAAYIQTIDDYVASYSGNDPLVFNLIRFDDSGIPALTIAVPGYNVSMYVYRDGRVYQVADQWGYGAFGVAGYDYILGQGVIYYSDADYAGALRYDTYLSLTETYEFESMYGDMHMQFFEGDTPGNTYLDEPLYYVDGQQVSEEVYRTYGVEGNRFSLVGDYNYDQIMAFLTSETIPTVSTYEVVMQDVTWEEANAIAISRGGHLATINNDSEYYQIWSVIASSADTNGVYFVGGTLVNGQYLWTADNSMQPITEHWRSGEPSYTGSTEDGRTVDENYVSLCAFRTSGDYYNYELLDVPNDMIDAAATYAGNVGFIIEYEI